MVVRTRSILVLALALLSGASALASVRLVRQLAQLGFETSERLKPVGEPRSGSVAIAPLRASELRARAPSPSPPATHSSAPPKLPSSAALTPCGTTFRLLASVVNVRQPMRSVAAVRAFGGTRMMKTGQQVGELQLVAIRPTRALFRNHDGALCALRIEGASSPPHASASVPPQHRPSTLTPADLSSGVRKLNRDSYAISRQLVEKALTHPSTWARSARFRVARRDGRVQGLELLTLRADSPLAALGLRRGDVLRKLNGHDLTTPGDALEALSQLRAQRSVSLSLERAGAVRSLTYRQE